MAILFILFAIITPPRLFEVATHKSLPPEGVEIDRVAVAFAPIETLRQLASGDLVLIPTSDGDREYRIVRVSSYVPGTLSLTAQAVDGSGDHLALTFDGDRTTGISQSIRNNRFDVFGTGYRAKVDPAQLDHRSCGADELHDPSDHLPDVFRMDPVGQVPEPLRKLHSETASAGLDSVTIDLMLVYTPKAEIWANASSNPGSLNAAIAQAMNLSQQALDVSQLAIRLRLVHLHRTEYDEASGANSTVHLQRLTAMAGESGWPEGTLGHMDEIHGLRDQYGADLVALLADVDDTGGLAWRLRNYGGRPNNGFSLNRIKQTHFTYTLIHEIGHNMGNSHGRATTQASSPADRFGGLHSYSVGYRWTSPSGSGFTTVMHYTSTGFSGTPYFSSTSQMVDGVAIGSALPDSMASDNARSMREIRRTIASYRPTRVHLSDMVLPSTLIVSVPRGESRSVEIPILNQGTGNAMWRIRRVSPPPALAKSMESQAHEPRVLYQTGFEASQGFPLGTHTILNDWRTFSTSVGVVVSNAAPKSGSQHLRWRQSSGVQANQFAFIDSPQFPGSIPGKQTLSFDFRQSNPGSRFDMYVYDTHLNTMAVGWIVDANGNVFVRPGPSTGTFSFLANAALGQYHSVSAELDPSAGKIRYRLNGGPASESDLSGKTRFNVMSFVPQNPASAGPTVDIDNVSMSLDTPYLPGFVFPSTEGTLRAGTSGGIPLTVHTEGLNVGTYVGEVELDTDSGVRSSRIEIRITDPLSVDGDDALPTSFTLAQNVPNPFNPNTVIGYRLSVDGPVRMGVYDLLGREVAVLVDEVKPAGAYSVTFDASRLASGVYLYRLHTGNGVLSRKMVLIK